MVFGAKMKNVVSDLAAQYEKWVYPKPISDLHQYFQSGKGIYSDPSKYFYRFWPDRVKFDPNILVAGCGTNLAAQIAFRNPKSKVTGIDLSNKSVQHSIALKQKYDLDNLTLFVGDFMSESFDEDFDLIVSTGVLHHLESPEEGALALKRWLKREGGVMYIMVYGMALRFGIYMLQKAFQQIGLDQSENDLRLARAALAALPENHPVQSYVSKAKELDYDGAFVDTFLHKQDRAFWADEVFDFVDAIDMEFQSWMDPGLYHPVSVMKPEHPLFNQALALEPRQQSVFIDRLFQRLGTHRFLVRIKQNKESQWRLKFDSPDVWTWTPHVHHGLTIKRSNKIEGQYTLKRSGMQQNTSKTIAALIELIDGKKTLEQCFMAFGFKDINIDDQKDGFIFAIKELYQLGHITIQKV
jgi:SAM-dependent methyltransferase